MPDNLCEFTSRGIAAFSKWLRAGALGNVPDDLLVDPEFSTPLCKTELLVKDRFPDRYSFGCRLVQLLSAFDSHSISYKRSLWSWLAAWYFDQLSEIDSSGRRILRREYVYVPQNDRYYYRHLVRTPWYVVLQHGEAAKFLLISTRKDDPAPLSRQSGLLDALAARQFVIASPTLVGAARRLYTDKITGRPTRGAGAHGSGSPRRLALIANQLALTYDIRDMPTENFLRLLPEEFSARW
jgi:hypothetical protein